MLKKGQKAPDFELANMEGGTTTLSAVLAEGPAVLSFFKSSCPVCQFTFPFLERIHQAAGEDGPRIFGISQDTAATTEYFLSDNGVKFPTLLDNSSNSYEVSNAYRIRNVPSIYVVEQDGTISEVMEGFEKQGLEELGERVGANTFEPGEDIPVFRPG